MNDQAATPKPPARIVGGPARTASVSLTWPVEFAGRTYTEIAVQRLTARQVDEFVTAVRNGDEDARLPIFDAPPEVLDALDADDMEKLNEVARPFTPRALRPAPASSSETSDTSQASSLET